MVFGSPRLMVEQTLGVWAAFKAAARKGAILACLTLTVFALLAPMSDSAQANRKYASIVVAEETGEILYARNSKSRRYPASLTKVMTLYLLFEDLAVGKITLDTKFKVSRYAANQPPSKLGIKRGKKIKVRDAIKALVVRSANDVAVVVAEGLSKTERKFAKRMTARARALGMSRTTFRNASGLPNRHQVTTAHDMALLGRAIARDFPQYFHYFETKKFSWGGRTWRTHNHVLRRYKGADGIKTGYTRASGFNLVTSAERNGARLVGVVLGGRTPKRRDRDMTRILNLTFKRIKKNPRKYRRKLMAAVPTPVLYAKSKPAPVAMAAIAPKAIVKTPPAQKPKLKKTLKPARVARLVASIAPVERPSVLTSGPALRTSDLEPKTNKALPKPARRVTLPLRTAEAELTQTAKTPSTAKVDPVELKRRQARRQVTTDGAIAAMTASLTQGDLAVGKRITVPLTAAVTLDANDETTGEGDGAPVYGSEFDGMGTRGIQVGAFRQFAQANLHIQHAKRIASGAIPANRAAIVPARTPSGQIYRVRFGPLSEDQVDGACVKLKAQGLDCFPIQDENWSAAIRP